MMRRSLLWHVAWWAVPVAVSAGCGTRSEPKSVEKRPRAVSTQGLPKLGDYLPPLDDGRIEFAAPEGWHFPSRSDKCIARAQKSATAEYPSIVLTAEDYENESLVNVSAKNVAKFAGQVAAAVKKDKSAVKPVEIGKFVGVAYAKRAKVRRPVTRILEVLYLETVVAGRKYRFELRSEEGSLEKDEPYLHAVVNGVRFAKAGAEEEPGGMELKDEGKQETQEEPAKGDLDLDKLDDLLK